MHGGEPHGDAGAKARGEGNRLRNNIYTFLALSFSTQKWGSWEPEKALLWRSPQSLKERAWNRNAIYPTAFQA
ncbi:hypothetical protein GCM10028803_04450 [Larkinella knui]